MPPIFRIFFIAVDISWCIFRSLFTSCTVVPAPFAMRILRFAFNSSGLPRSFGVIERITASMRPSSLSSAPAFSACAASLPMPGSIPIRPAMPPIFFIC